MSVNSQPAENRDQIISMLKALLEPTEATPSKEDLVRAADQLASVEPYNFEIWRLHADLLLNALKQLLNRRLQQDLEVKILSIPLREDALRDAAELALRQCAHYADNTEQRVSCVNEANSVRRYTWF